MKTSRLLATLALALSATLAGCHHDHGDVCLRLQNESLGTTKLAVLDATAEWTAGDSVWINGDVYAIDFDGNNRATTLVPHADTYNAVFPAAIAAGANSVCLPNSYHYSTDLQGRQLLALPMIAQSTGENLFFYHLTGALMIKYVNQRDAAVTLDHITVKSNRYAISGTRAITFGDTAQAPQPIATPADSSVTILFDWQTTQVAPGDTIAVMIPVAPTGADNQFTVVVSSHIEGRRYTVSNTQQTAHRFHRNELSYAYMTLSNTNPSTALFKVSPGDASQTYLISSATDLKLLQQAINNRWTDDYDIRYSRKNYTIDSDIDMSGYEIEPISGYTGASFDGDGHTISNITITSSTQNCALFDTIRAGTSISNIILTNLSLENTANSTSIYISPLIAVSFGIITISNCSTYVNVINASSNNIYYGGIVATNLASITITNCNSNNNCTITSNDKIFYGGIVGQADANISCTSCNTTNNTILYANGQINAGGGVGNGKTKTLNMNDVYCTDFISASTNTANIYLGGLVGYLNLNTSFLNGNNCTFRGELSANTNGTNILYIGKLYGYGKLAGRYQLTSTRYDASNLTIPPDGSLDGLIKSGDPTGNH